MGGWECGSVGGWECGRMGVWEYGRMGGWEDGRMGGWEDGRRNPSHTPILPDAHTFSNDKAAAGFGINPH